MAQPINNVGQNEYLPYKPIKFYQAPSGMDYSEVGHVGIDVVSNTAYIAGNQVNGLQTWIPYGGAAIGAVVAALTVNPGNLTVTAGNLVVTAGTIEASASSIMAGTSLIAGTSIVALGGDITTVLGNVVIGDPTKGINMGSGVKIL